ncbi:MAG TPA: vWA domain-containing protein, partial [Planctomycetota bacterium]|nr:vWA domain-containing protein [Planctomycetota bacterium]
SASEPLIEALAHDAWQVRVAAARSLAALRDKAALPALVERLSVEKGRARAETVAALEAISGQRIGDAPKRWAAVLAGTDATAVAETPPLPPTFFGAPVTGQRVVFVIDRSLNMRDEHPFLGPEHRERLEALCTPPDGERIAWRALKTKQQLAFAHLRHAVDGLPKGTSVEVVHFAEDVKGVFNLKLTTIGSATRKTLYDTLALLETDDGINLFGALNAALDVGGATDEKAFKSGPDQVFLVTNNIPTKGDVTEATGVLAAIALKARVRMVAISVVGIGNHPFELAEGLARRTGGVYVNLSK